jgi:hypothetical protein
LDSTAVKEGGRRARRVEVSGRRKVKKGIVRKRMLDARAQHLREAI